MATKRTKRSALQIETSEQNRFMEQLMEEIVSFYDEKFLTDVTFKFSNATALVPAHRLILAAASPYFKSLFNGDQGNNPIIEINYIDSDTFERLITFCYTGQAPIDVTNVGAMLKAAIRLQLDDAITRCVEYLMAHIDEFTIQGAYSLERETKCKFLKQKIMEYETKNLMKISQSDEFLNFEEELQRILEDMRFTEPRGVSAANFGEKTLMAFCSEDKLLQYNKAEDKWQDYASIEMTRIDYERYAIILNDDNFLFTGGKKDNKALNIVYSWNIRNKTWQNFPAMNKARWEHRGVELDGKIYVIGGLDESGVLSSVERYTTSDGWEVMSSLIVRRIDHRAVTLNGKIYVMGGKIRKSGSEAIKSVECYNPNSNRWSTCADMIYCRRIPFAAAHKGHIYVVGNFYGEGINVVERYDPQQNKWTQIYSLEKGCKFTDSVSLDNELWAIGITSKYSAKEIVSVYDEENNRWEQKYSIPENIGYCYVVPVALLK